MAIAWVYSFICRLLMWVHKLVIFFLMCAHVGGSLHMWYGFIQGLCKDGVHLLCTVPGGWTFFAGVEIHRGGIFNMFFKILVIFILMDLQLNYYFPYHFLKSLYLWSRNKNLSKKEISLVVVPIISSQTLRFLVKKRVLL